MSENSRYRSKPFIQYIPTQHTLYTHIHSYCFLSIATLVAYEHVIEADDKIERRNASFVTKRVVAAVAPEQVSRINGTTNRALVVRSIFAAWADTTDCRAPESIVRHRMALCMTILALAPTVYKLRRINSTIFAIEEIRFRCRQFILHLS